MLVFLYNIFILFYKIAIKLAALFNKKASYWVKGRRNIFHRLSQDLMGNNAPVIWIHCASLGEFEQSRPVLESLKKQYINQKFLLTFFSPSGYENRKNYSEVEWVYYLPLDNKKNASRFLNIVQPCLAIFVKYEYWYYYLNGLHEKRIPVLLIAAVFREDAVFFKWYGGLQREMVNFFTHVFVQDRNSKKRLSKIYPEGKITISGDTRFDRVLHIALNFEPIDLIKKFIEDKQYIIVAGSTWPHDEKNIKALMGANTNLTLIVAPHETNLQRIKFLQQLFPNNILFSELDKSTITNEKVLIIDQIGLLSKLYFYGTFSYVGGGFNKAGIHNTLEAAVYGKPVLFGPNYKKFNEAACMIKNGAGFSYNNESQLREIVRTKFHTSSVIERAGNAAKEYVYQSGGATKIITTYIHKNLL